MKIVGISACPAGLAHTPMAAKALEKAGAKMGYDVKIEQQGSLG
ncbi:PTS fructose transporter subunit IIB, partial [Enterococcus avium]